MSRATSYFCSTVGRKQVVGLTGIGLSLFTLTHMLGNLLIFIGPEAYNSYGHNIVNNPFIYVAEAILLTLFVSHLGLALKLTHENSRARTQPYAVSAEGDKATSLIQKTMWHQGIVLGTFLVYHLITFKFGTYYTYVSESNGEEIRDLYRLIIEVFSQPAYVFGYIICLIILGFHLSHGFSSAVRTLGFNHPKYDCGVRILGKLFAATVALGFISQPLYVFFIYKP